MRKPNLKPRIPDIAGNKKYDDYDPKSVGDSANVDKKLSGKSKALLVGALLVSVGIGYAAVGVVGGSDSGGVSIPTGMPAKGAGNSEEQGEQSPPAAETEKGFRYDSKTSTTTKTLVVGGLDSFTGKYEKSTYEKSLKYSKDLEKKYKQNFKFYPIMGQDEKGIDILSAGDGFGFRASGNGDTLYGLLYGKSSDTQKWRDEYSQQFPQITSIHRALPTRLMSGQFKYDDVSVTQRIASPDMLITVDADGDYTEQVKGFSTYLAGSDGFEGSFKITVQTAPYEVLGKFMNKDGSSKLTYENFYSTVTAADIGAKQEFQIKSKEQK